MDAVDVEVAADYFVIASTLVFLKSKALLPPIPVEFEIGEESAEVVEARLRERLIAYSQATAMPAAICARALEASAYYVRAEGGDPDAELVQRYRIDVAKLARALEAALRTAKPEKRTIVRERVSLGEQMELIARTVRRDGKARLLRAVRRAGSGHDHRHVSRRARTRAARPLRRPRKTPRSTTSRSWRRRTPPSHAKPDPQQTELLETGRSPQHRSGVVRRLRTAFDQDARQADRCRRSRRDGRAAADRRRVRRAWDRVARNRRRLPVRQLAGAREAVEAYLMPPKTNLSPAALETLAIVAYMQPVPGAISKKSAA